MTENNKPIIIDGVDVSGCEDYGYRGNAGYWCHNYDEPCTDYPNCYFKQLVRKTQYLEIILKTFDIEYIRDKETNQIIVKCNKLLAKEQECEELKHDKVILLRDWEDKKNENYEIACKNERLVQQLDKLKTEKEQVERKLERIKDIANYSFNLSTSELMAKLEQIIQIIDEVV